MKDNQWDKMKSDMYNFYEIFMDILEDDEKQHYEKPVRNFLFFVFENRNQTITDRGLL